ncbi:MAG: nuclear transport factor 2 family protein [Planctomycetota bacterium]
MNALLTLPALLALALTPAPPTAAGPGAILEMQKALFAAIDRGDGAAAGAFVAPDRKGPGGMTSLFLVDRSGAAISASDVATAREALARLAAESKSAGGTFETRITSENADCPGSELSFAVLEFERRHTVGGKVETRRYRGTLLARHDGSEWKVCHWHVSPGSTRG